MTATSPTKPITPIESAAGDLQLPAAAPEVTATELLTKLLPQFWFTAAAAELYVREMGKVPLVAPGEKMFMVRWRHELQVGFALAFSSTPSGR